VLSVVDNQLALFRKPTHDVAVIFECDRTFRYCAVGPNNEGVRPGSITDVARRSRAGLRELINLIGPKACLTDAIQQNS
jgi:hypothetical protein